MQHLSRSLAEDVARRHGVVTNAQLNADGISNNSIRHLVTTGSLVRLHKCVFRIATSPDTFESRCAAACLADPAAVISGPSGANLWNFRHVFRATLPDVLVEHDRTPLSRGVRLRRTNILPSTDVVERDDGIRLASPPRTWFDCGRDLDDERFERLTEWVIDHHSAVPTLWAMAKTMSKRGRSGAARVNRVLSLRSGWQRPAGSGLELDVINALRRRGISPLVQQFPLRLPNGIVIHPDGADPISRWAVEVDHVTWHGGRFDAQRDKGRDRNARRIGWQVDRVTDLELSANFNGAIAELYELWLLRRAEQRVA